MVRCAVEEMGRFARRNLRHSACLEAIIQQQMVTAFDWPFAAALSTILIIVTTTLYIIYSKVMSDNHMSSEQSHH